jgi:hypothetical protein
MNGRTHYPKPTAAPCNECPWRRDARPGHLGPYSPEDWAKIAHRDGPIACHKTIVVTNPLEGSGDWDHPKMRQCRGAAIFRRQVGKEPRNEAIVTCDPDPIVFDDTNEFVVYHGGEEMERGDIYEPLSTERIHDFDLRNVIPCD